MAAKNPRGLKVFNTVRIACLRQVKEILVKANTEDTVVTKVPCSMPVGTDLMNCTGLAGIHRTHSGASPNL